MGIIEEQAWSQALNEYLKVLNKMRFSDPLTQIMNQIIHLGLLDKIYLAISQKLYNARYKIAQALCVACGKLKAFR